MWAFRFPSSVASRFGAGNGIRTRDIQLGRLTLYQLSYSRAVSLWWREKDSNLRRREPADLQSAPFGRSGIPPGRLLGEFKPLTAQPPCNAPQSRQGATRVSPWTPTRSVSAQPRIL